MSTRSNRSNPEELVDWANRLIRDLHVNKDCRELRQLFADAVSLYERFVAEVEGGEISVTNTGPGTATTEVRNAWSIAIRRLAQNGCISNATEDWLKGLMFEEWMNDRRYPEVRSMLEDAEEAVADRGGIPAPEGGLDRGESFSLQCASGESVQALQEDFGHLPAKGDVEQMELEYAEGPGEFVACVLTEHDEGQ